MKPNKGRKEKNKSVVTRVNEAQKSIQKTILTNKTLVIGRFHYSFNYSLRTLRTKYQVLFHDKKSIHNNKNSEEKTKSSKNKCCEWAHKQFFAYTKSFKLQKTIHLTIKYLCICLLFINFVVFFSFSFRSLYFSLHNTLKELKKKKKNTIS